MADNMPFRPSEQPKKQPTPEYLQYLCRDMSRRMLVPEKTPEDEKAHVSLLGLDYLVMSHQLTRPQVLEYLGKKGYTNTEASLRQEADAHERLSGQPMMVGGPKYERAYGKLLRCCRALLIKKHCSRTTSTTLSRCTAPSSLVSCGPSSSTAL